MKDRAIANRKSQIENPLVLVRTTANRQEIVAVSEEARSFGIRPGMTLAQGRALCAHVEHLEHEPHRDAVALEALGRWMMRFTPVVALDTPSALLLDLTGCERAFGGLRNILKQVHAAMQRFRIRARLALAPTPGAAWAAAFGSGQPVTVIEPDKIAETIAPLPPIALRIEPEVAESLNHLGINTIGRLMKLPRSSLPARFGPDLLHRLDQALGSIAEPLVPLEPFAPIQARMDFEGPVESLEALWMVFKQLVTRVVADLLRRGHGAREMEVEFFRPYAITLRKTIGLSRPSRNPTNLFNLLRCAMETVQTDVGFLGIRINITRSQRITDEQICLLEHEEFAAETELSHLIERLCIRLGNRVIEQPVLVESHVPEKAYACHGLTEFDRPSATKPRPVDDVPGLEPSVRPLHLLKIPHAIGVMVTPSHDREGRPVSFSWQGNVHRLSQTVGPERIAGQWWQNHNRTRDYFDVEDELGARFWIFRVRETGQWYVHGEFE